MNAYRENRDGVVGVHDELRTRAVRKIRAHTAPEVRRRILERARTLSNANFAIGIEILPHRLVAVLTDTTCQPFARRQRELTNERLKPEALVSEIDDLVRDMVATSLGVDLPSRRVAIGLQIGGPVDSHRRVVRHWRNHPTDPLFAGVHEEWKAPVPLAVLVEEATGCATLVENDATAYAAFELRDSGESSASFAVILVRDGVGGGIIRDHHVMSIPFEIGHLIVHPNGRACACENHGCIEAYAGGRAIRGVVGERNGVEPDDLRSAIALGDTDAEVRKAFKDGGEAIARGIATILTLFGIDRVVIYGDPELCGGRLDRPAVAAFFNGVGTYRDFAFASYQTCEIERRAWHSIDGALGAALVALNQLFFMPLVDLQSA